MQYAPSLPSPCRRVCQRKSAAHEGKCTLTPVFSLSKRRLFALFRHVASASEPDFVGYCVEVSCAPDKCDNFTMTNFRRWISPTSFWYYFGVVYALYAVFVLGGIKGPLSPYWPVSLSLPAFILLDMVALPALIFAWLWRDRPPVALVGAIIIVAVGVLAGIFGLGPMAVSAGFGSLVPGKAIVVIGLPVVMAGYEARVLWEVVRLRRRTNFDVAISRQTTVRPGDLWIVRRWKKAMAVELRFWMYGLVRKPPALNEFPGDRHFSYGAQSANANTWIAWAIINLLPLPILHFAMYEMSPGAADIGSLLTVLSALWCLAEARASKSRPVSLDAKSLHLRYGLKVGRTIELADIQAARSLGWEDFDARGVTRYAGLGGANLRLELRGDEVIHLGLDDPRGFLDELAQKRCQGQFPGGGRDIF